MNALAVGWCGEERRSPKPSRIAPRACSLLCVVTTDPWERAPVFEEHPPPAARGEDLQAMAPSERLRGQDQCAPSLMSSPG